MRAKSNATILILDDNNKWQLWITFVYSVEYHAKLPSKLCNIYQQKALNIGNMIMPLVTLSTYFFMA